MEAANSFCDEINILEHRAMFSQEAALILAEVRAFRVMKANDEIETCVVDRIRTAAKTITDCDAEYIAGALGDGTQELAERSHAALLAWRRDGEE